MKLSSEQQIRIKIIGTIKCLILNSKE